jgi:uncharacterized protein YndB with AHSA1/START domain
MSKGFIANESVVVNAPVPVVWDALVNPEIIKQYMFGTNVVSDWREGASIAWKGEWQGKRYEDKGVILRLQPQRLIQYSHISPLSGLPDRPESYHTVTVQLSADSDRTIVSLTQDNNPDEEAREHAEKNWKAMLKALKSFLEKSR